MSNIIRPFNPVITGRPDNAGPGHKPQATPTADGNSFRELLDSRLRAQAQQHAPVLSFSKHAQARTAERGISLSEADLQKLDLAAEKAQAKGLTDTLVFMNNTAFIVNIPGRVVVTVVDQNDTEPQVFTNIDGAVMV